MGCVGGVVDVGVCQGWEGVGSQIATIWKLEVDEAASDDMQYIQLSLLELHEQIGDDSLGRAQYTSKCSSHFCIFGISGLIQVGKHRSELMVNIGGGPSVARDAGGGGCGILQREHERPGPCETLRHRGACIRLRSHEHVARACNTYPTRNNVTPLRHLYHIRMNPLKISVFPHPHGAHYDAPCPTRR